ncbi:MAG: outer membrane beta-barrel domain-containing protein [Bdellovibrionales bacterium]
MTKAILLFLVSFVPLTYSWADEIEVPEEELARETTLPVFDKRRAVLNRSVLTDQKFELGAGFGLEMNEPFYNDYMFNLQGTYNFTETSALNVLGLFWMDGLSDYGEQLKPGRAASGSQTAVEAFDASKAPHPTWALFGNYQFIAYYGKISVSKLGVMNLNLFGIVGLGYINMDSVSTVGLNLGVGQNFFFTKNFALRFDLRWLIFQGPNATTKQLRPQDNPSATSFDDRIFYNGQMSLAGVFIL